MKMNKIIKIAFFLTLISMFFPQIASTEEYTRSCEFKPIHIERNEILKVATEIYMYVKKSNGETIKTAGYIRLGRDDYSTKLNLPLEQNDYDKFPKASYDGDLTINAYGGTISEVDLRFFDGLRKITIKGINYDQITGLIKVAEEKLKPYESVRGGPYFRLFLYIIFFIVWIFLFSFFNFRIKISSSGLEMPVKSAIVYVLSFIMFFIFVYLPSWEKIFPGFLAGPEGRSFLERNSALFTFIGLLIAIITPIIRFVASRVNKKNSTNTKQTT